MSVLNMIILTLHIIGSIGVFSLVVGAFASILQSKSARFAGLARYIAIGTVFQIVSGSALMIASNGSMSVAHFCERIAVYMGIVIVTEALLFMKMRTTAASDFPRQSLAASFAVSMGVFLVTVLVSL